VGAFRANQLGDKAAAAESEAALTGLQAGSEALGSDPQLQRLYQLANLGVPGADKALERKLAPKEESTGAFTQFLATGPDPEAAAAIAPRFGMDPEVARQAAMSARNREDQIAGREHEQALEVARARAGNKQPRSPTEVELFYSDPAAYARYIEAKNAGKAPGKRDLRAELVEELQKPQPDMKKITALKDAISLGQRSSSVGAVNLPASLEIQRGKMMERMDEQLKSYDKIVSPSTNAKMDEIINDPKNFTLANKLANQASQAGASNVTLGVPGIGGITIPGTGALASVVGNQFKTPGSSYMDTIFMSQALSDMSKLGGSDSNEELRKIQSQYPSVANNQEAAKMLWENFKRWNEINREAIRMQYDRVVDKSYWTETDPAKREGNFYRQAEEKLVREGVIAPGMLEIPTSGTPQGAADLSGYDLMGLTPEEFMTLTPAEREQFRRGN
jgi:hypothetical protein